MKKQKLFTVILISLFIAFSFVAQQAQAQPTAPQTIGGIAQQEETISSDRNLNRLIKEKKARAAEEASEEIIPDDSSEKVLVTQITIENATLLSQSDLNEVIFAYEDKELSLKQMQKVADLVTDKYRIKGYATSRAYIPPQTIKDGLLIIRVIEGRLGNLSIEGNRHFKSSLLRDKMSLEPNGYFDYSALQESLVYINEHPDRTASVVLMPGAEPGTTDVVMNIEDNYPFHVTLSYDNYGSRYIEKDRYAVALEHNNLLGFDDKLLVKVQNSEAYRLQMLQIRYLFPINSGLNLGAYYVKSRSLLGQEFIDLGAGGKAEIIGIFGTQVLKQTDDLDLRLNVGFDYKDILNEINSSNSSDDDIRVLKAGFDIDYIDDWGRNILTVEADIGIPDFMGGMPAKDPLNASRASAGGKFQKYMVNYYRLQPMLKETALLWKNNAQYSNHNLLASEQFQIGGPTSVRGYAPAEYAGDKGYYTSLEWSGPFYGLSRDVEIPYRDEKLYDCFRWVLFYDYGYVGLKTTSTSENKDTHLKAWGVGTRLNVSDDIELRFEVGYPIGKPDASDGDHAHPWIEFIAKF